MSFARTTGIALGTALGAGFSPVAPGTCGTIVAVPLYYALSGFPLWLYLITLAGLTAAGTWAAKITGDAYGEVDHQRIVIDEVAGYLVTMTLNRPTPATMAAGFVLFRLFDIVKPWPVGWADRKVVNAFGVMLDDLLAGACALAILQVLKVALPAYF